MDLSIATWLPLERFAFLMDAPLAELWLAAAILGLAATVHASGIPGLLLPLSFSSGALLGNGLGIATVVSGALLGSSLLYALFRKGPPGALKEKYGPRLQRFDALASRGGLFPIIGLRIIGTPHIIVTALCALAAIGPKKYAVATIAGILPAIAISATAGAAI